MPPVKRTSSSKRIRTFNTPALLRPWQKSMRMKAVEKEREKNELRFQQYVEGIVNTRKFLFSFLILLQHAWLPRITLLQRKLHSMMIGCHAKK
jgi:hypothetical protein